MTEQSPDTSEATPAGAVERARSDPSYLAHTIETIPPADAAALLADMDANEAAAVAEFLDPQTASDVISEMEHAAAADVLAHMQPPEASMVLHEMDPDDRVDVLGHLTPAQRDAVLAEMDAADAADVRNLRQYPPDTAGGIMTTQVTALPEALNVEQAIGELRRINETLEQMV